MLYLGGIIVGFMIGNNFGLPFGFVGGFFGLIAAGYLDDQEVAEKQGASSSNEEDDCERSDIGDDSGVFDDDNFGLDDDISINPSTALSWGVGDDD